MTYYKDITAEYEDIEDRYELMVERIRSITKEETVDMRYRDYFVRTGEFLLQLDKVIEKVKSGMSISISLIKKLNKLLCCAWSHKFTSWYHFN